jgi:hypothetical protein
MTSSRSRRSHRVLVAAALAGTMSTTAVPTIGAQQPTPAPQAPLAAYRVPTIALVQPAGGSTIPQDKPVVVFRFAQGEPTDPVDVQSFTVVVDGYDRTSLFQVSAGEAWGPLGDSAHPLPAGVHQVTARICSTRGACATVSATVTAVADPAGAATGAVAPARRRAWLVDLVLQAARKLLQP